MKLSVFTFLAATTLQARLCTAASTNDTVTIPTCGLLCTVEIAPTTVCSSYTNLTCICTDEDAISQIGACVLANCSIRDALSTEKYSDVSCGRSITDNSKQVVVTTPLFGSLAVLFWLLRVLSRYMTGFKATWGLDDWIILPTVIASIPMTALSFILSKHGLGKDMWMVPFDNITDILYLYYWDEILYLFVVPATKISILCFYLRIFPQTAFRIWAYGLIAANVAFFFAFELITIFQCTPIPGAWLSWDDTYAATCRDVNLQAWVAAAVSIVLDVATVALPLPELWKLNLSMKKKLQVMLMFAVGLFVTVVSILRLQYLLIFAKTSNLTQDFVPVGVWSTVETSVGIMCACMPAIRSLFATIAPKVFGSTHEESKYPTGSSSFSAKTVPSKIRIKSEFVLSSRSKHQDESSFVELTPFESDDYRHIGTPSQLELEDDRRLSRKPTTARESV